MARDYYKTLIVAPSGKGKTYMFRNLNPETTGFINDEDKPLPFKNKFKYHTRTTTLEQTKSTLKDYAANKEINCIVLDSLSSYMDKLLKEARTTKKGFDVWNYYNEELGKFLGFIKSIQKEVFITGHTEWLSTEEGARERRLKTKGKEWEGVVEKEFTIVMYADNTFVNGKPEYKLHLVLEDSSAKCPPEIFGEGVYSIPNDANEILNKIIEFTK